jgi:hypothetical protein
VDWISREYSYHGEAPVGEIVVRQCQHYDILIMPGHKFGYGYVALWRFYHGNPQGIVLLIPKAISKT